LERKEELELIKIKQQQKNCVQSFGASKMYTSSTERKTKLELPEDGNNINLVITFLSICSNYLFIFFINHSIAKVK